MENKMEGNLGKIEMGGEKVRFGEVALAEEVERVFGQQGGYSVSERGREVEWEFRRKGQVWLRVKMRFSDEETGEEFWNRKSCEDWGSLLYLPPTRLRKEDKEGVGDEEDKGGKEEAI